MTTAVTTPSPLPLVLRTSSGRRFRDRAARVVLTCGALTTFAITVLIIGTLAFDVWDFVRQITAAEKGLGWQLVLVFLAAAGFAAGASWLAIRVRGADSARLGSAFRVLTFVGVAAIGLTIVGGWTMLNRLGTEITQVGWFPRRGLSDISTIIVGTFVIVLIAMAVAVPLGLGAAIYLAEFAQPRGGGS